MYQKKDFDSLRFGEKLLVSGEEFLWKMEWIEPGLPATFICKTDIPFQGKLIYVALDDEHQYANIIDDFSDEVQLEILSNLKLFSSRLDLTSRCWAAYASLEAIRFLNFDCLSSEVYEGIHTCKCGFMNLNVSISSIFNGEYICRQCRYYLK